MPAQKIAVIGGGAKAAALAAKARCINSVHQRELEITIFERSAIGANWDGEHGYTDGLQRLCTPAERDLGFPYDSAPFGAGVTAAMQAVFSWHAVVAASTDVVCEDERWEDYGEWLDLGRKPPRHRTFARYLRHAVDKAQAAVRIGTVEKIELQGDRWAIRHAPPIGPATVDAFDGLVFTGPGPAKTPRIGDDHLFNGETFWRNLDRVRDVLDGGSPHPVVLVGGGGTTAAIAAWFAGNYPDREVHIVAKHGTLFLRTHNYFESRMFSRSEAWAGLSHDEKTAFVKRLNRGVVWASVLDVLENARALVIDPGEVANIRREAMGGRSTLVVDIVGKAGPLDAALVVDGGGFDPWWFRSLMPDAVQRATATDAQRLTLEAAMADDLSITVPGCPRFHVPMVATAVGAGLSSLMALGEMSDAVLSCYWHQFAPIV